MREPFVRLDISTRTRDTREQCVPEFMGFLTSTHPERFHTYPAVRMHAAAKGPAHTCKGNEACFQLSGITLLAGYHYRRRTIVWIDRWKRENAQGHSRAILANFPTS